MIFCFSPLMILCAAVRFNYRHCFDPSPTVKCCFPLHWLYFLLQLPWAMSSVNEAAFSSRGKKSWIKQTNQKKTSAGDVLGYDTFISVPTAALSDIESVTICAGEGFISPSDPAVWRFSNIRSVRLCRGSCKNSATPELPSACRS